ncbi:hypothetical protein [Marinobacter sp. F4216]|uniref:hypothetical protein n=1 Tax=Marinobacter sp. F4216 TaxID=2874281 RepID=UPI001CC11B5D|nr:hypothetical protein [Marinobacter sp. F4216]
MTKLRMYPVALAVLLTVGCGGSGGGNGAPPEEDGGDATTRQTIDSEDGATPLTLDSGRLAEKQAMLREQEDFNEAMNSYWTVSGVLFLFGDIEESLQNVPGEPDGSLVEVPDIPVNGTINCTNSGGTAAVEGSGEESSGGYRILFDSCRVDTSAHGSFVLSGSYLVDWSESEDTVDLLVTQHFDITGQQLNSEGQTRDIQVKGSLVSSTTKLWKPDPASTLEEPKPDILVGFDANIQWPVLEVFIGSDYFALRDSEFNFVETEGEVSFGWNVDLISSVMGGAISFTTPVEMVVTEGDSCASYGHLLLEGDGKIEARYGVTSGRRTGMELLINDSEVIFLESCGVLLPI